MVLILFLLSLQLVKVQQIQAELLASQRQTRSQPSNLPARLIRDAHNFAETFMANVTEETARSYSLEVLKLATGLVDFGNKQIPYKPRVVSYPPMEHQASHSLGSLSPLINYQLMNQAPSSGRREQRSSWGGATPNYGRPSAMPVAGTSADEPTSFLRNLDLEPFNMP